MATQKTWNDLLGPFTPDCCVDGQYIIRRQGNACRVLWRFDDSKQAKTAFDFWKESSDDVQ